ncbi:MAG: Right handed beta helix region [Candidatus Methanoperedenaceae archaeon GB50]|nr:MAG: Right handed beta helix region [Candidatus Methanoperedenaceae archaeon GB50]
MREKGTKKLFMFLSILLSIFLLTTIANAAIYYVDQNHPQASDENPGTEELPWKTLIHGCAQVKAGDILLVKNGVYASQKISPPGWIPGIQIKNSGTETAPIIVKAYPGHSPIIDGKTAEGYYTFGGHRVSHIIIDGLIVRDGIIIFDESSYITIQNCELIYGWTKKTDPSYTNMIEFRYTHFSTVRNCIIHGNKFVSADGGSNRAAIILHWCNDILIENNLFYDNIISYRNKSSGGGVYGHRNIFRKNIVRDCNKGVYMRGYEPLSHDNRIEQNIFINNSKSILLDLGNSRLIIANNVFYADPGFNPEGDPTSGITYAYEAEYNPDHQIFNNIIVNLESPISDHTTDWPPPNLYCDYNCYANFVGFDKRWEFITFEEFKNRTGGNEHCLVNQDPLFVNPEAHDFHLRENSPCRNTGKDGVNMGAYITGNEIIGPILNQGPQVSNESPARNATDVPRNTNISFDITDSDGVDQSSISVSVNGNNVTSSCAITAISNGFHVLYDPPEDFDYRQDVTVLVTATDGLGNTTNDSWSFKIKQLSDVIGFDASLNESSVKLTWEVPDDPDYAGVEIRCFSSPDHNYEVYPANHTEGTFVCRVNKPGESCIHNDVIENYRYNYSAFSYDAQNNYTETVHTHVIVDVSPVISEVDSQPSTNSAVITWTTDEPATSQVEYGLNTDYGSLTNLDSNLVTSHSVTITGLVPETLYHYRVRSQDANGNEAISIDHTFTTHPLEPGTYTVILGDTPDSDYPGTLEDTFININEENNSNSQYLNTYTWPENSIANAIIMKWDLSNIPSSATIHNATLYLYLSDMEGDGGDDLYDLSVHKIINYNPVISACNGYTYDGINPWTPYSGLYNDIPLAQADIAEAEDTKSIDKTYGYKSWSVTNMVQEWVSNPDSNYGMLVNSDPVASQDSNRYFSSTESPNPDQRPKLVITYTISNAEPDITPPGEVSSFSVTPGNGQITLSWVNPTDDDFTGTMIRYRTDTYPT